MVEFKPIKQKHKRWANQVLTDLGLLESDIKDAQKKMSVPEVMEANRRLFRLAYSMVKSWDFVDAETGESLVMVSGTDEKGKMLPIPETDDELDALIDELTDEQVNEILDGFNALMDNSTVPKPKKPASSSGRGPRKKTRSTKALQSG